MMAYFFHISPEDLKGLNESERVEVKMMLYQLYVQVAIDYTREKHNLKPFKKLPKMSKHELYHYSWRLENEEWVKTLMTISWEARIHFMDRDFARYDWRPFLYLYTKHNVIVHPRILNTGIDEEAFDSLKKDQSERLVWEWFCRGFLNESMSDKEKEVLNKQIVEQQFQIACKEYADALERYKNKKIKLDELYSSFEERIVYNSPGLGVGLRLNTVRLQISPNATKKEIMAAIPYVMRCQRLCKEGKRKAPKYTEKKIDLLSDIAVMILSLEKEGMKRKDIAHVICSELKKRRLRYDIGSMRKMMSEAEKLHF